MAMYQKSCGLLRPEKILILLVMVVFILPGTFASSLAAEEKPAESGWEFTVAPYLWAISMDGSVTVGGLEADVDASVNDLLDAWIQTMPGKGWFTILRLYSPLEPFFTKEWRSTEVELVH